MRNIYEKYFAELLWMVRTSRDRCVELTEEFYKERGSLLNLGDVRYKSYCNMVETNESRAVTTIEQIAVLLFQERNVSYFSLYPIDPRYRNKDRMEQSKTRPFQVVLDDNGQKSGIVFCETDEGKYYQNLIDGKYRVDKLQLVKLMEPDEKVYEVLISSRNEYNKKCNVPLECVTLREFWEKHFGTEEYVLLTEYINQFNDQAREIIGFNTIVTPTDAALDRFRIKTGEMLKSYPYVDSIPQNIYQRQVDRWCSNYIDRGLWRAMVGTSNFALSFITSEWNYSMYLLTENLDLTSIVSGYLKSVEQLIWAIIGLQTQQSFQIKSKKGGLVEFSADDESIIDGTLGSLEQVFRKNSWMFDINDFARCHVVNAIDDWREKYRNGYFHKDNLQSQNDVEAIRSQTLQLYFLILGGCKINDSDFSKLGIQ